MFRRSLGEKHFSSSQVAPQQVAGLLEVGTDQACIVALSKQAGSGSYREPIIANEQAYIGRLGLAICLPGVVPCLLEVQVIKLDSTSTMPRG